MSSTTVGFSIEADRQLLDILNQKDGLAKYGVLLFDEMYIKQGLVFEKSTGALFGFTDLGDISNQLDEFLQSFKDHSDSLPRPLAKAMLVFMVKGLFNNVSLPYAQFPVCSVKGGDIFPLLWKAIGRLERIGYVVLGITCDGCSSNRRLFTLHRKRGTPTNELVYKTTNIFSNDQKDIFFFVDPPHLLKTIRNCFANPIRHLWCNGSEIRWKYILDLYLRNTGQITETPGLSLVPKIKYEHVHLTSFSKMRVDLAAEVMSETVSKALRLTGGEGAAGTALFIEMVDKMFDCLNVSTLSKGKLKRKPFVQPYRSSNDFRLKFLREELLPYFQNWERSAQSREGFSKEAINLMLLSKESRSAVDITGMIYHDY